jgi:2-oxoglutarate ferredoxin oxidoreductase subunit beta
VKEAGMPIKVCELLAALDGVFYLERVALDSVKGVRNAKKAINKAFKYQMEGKGFTLVEVVSNCPTYWGLDAPKSLEWMKETLIPYYPLGVYKDMGAE